MCSTINQPNICCDTGHTHGHSNNIVCSIQIVFPCISHWLKNECATCSSELPACWTHDLTDNLMAPYTYIGEAVQVEHIKLTPTVLQSARFQLLESTVLSNSLVASNINLHPYTSAARQGLANGSALTAMLATPPPASTPASRSAPR